MEVLLPLRYADPNGRQVLWVNALRTQFGQRLRQVRRNRNLTQEQLAERAKLSVEHISFLERGMSGTTLDTLGNLAEALGVSVKDLFDFEKLLEA